MRDAGGVELQRMGTQRPRRFQEARGRCAAKTTGAETGRPGEAGGCDEIILWKSGPRNDGSFAHSPCYDTAKSPLESKSRVASETAIVPVVVPYRRATRRWASYCR